MKQFTTLLAIAACAMFSSCLKGTDDSPADTSLVGNWVLVNDSTTTTFWGLWAGEPTRGSNYVGVASDHYNFLSNGTLYISEANVLDTATYQKIHNDTLTYKYWYPTWFNAAKYIVSNHTAHTLTLTSAYPAVSPETTYSHIINFKK